MRIWLVIRCLYFTAVVRQALGTAGTGLIARRWGGRAGPMQRFGAGVHLILGAAKVRFMENDYLCGLTEKHLQNIR